MGELGTLEIALLIVLGVSLIAFVYMFSLPYLNGDKAATKRFTNIAEKSTNTRVAAGMSEASNSHAQKRKQQVQKVLDELEEQKKEQKRVSMNLRIERAGMKIEVTHFYLICALIAIALGVGVFLMANGNLILTAITVIVTILGLPRWYLNKKALKRQRKFLDEFANAIDVIVRGIRSGLPLNDCLSIISEEIPDPVGGEFDLMNDQIRVGVPMTAALEKMYNRVPVQEVNFFAIVLIIQQQSGGNLAEALNNLSGVLRDRIRLKQKVQAYSSEAKSSAAIIGALPLVVMILVYLSSPDYITTLFTEDTGHLLLAISATLMILGTLVMKKMINFDY